MKRLEVICRHFAGPEAPSTQRGFGSWASATLHEHDVAQRLVDVPYSPRTDVHYRREYEQLYRQSISDPTGFWSQQAEHFFWKQKWEKNHAAWNFNMEKGPIFIRFYKGGVTNVTYNCLDRHVEAGQGDRTCFLWEGNEPGTSYRMTYKEVLHETCRLANWLKKSGVRKGDAVAIYMPLVCELPIAMLACARIGAVHSVVFGGFSAEALAQRMTDCRCKVLITATGGWRGQKSFGLKSIADKACSLAASQGFKVGRVLVLDHQSVPASEVPWQAGRDVWYGEEVSRQPTSCAVQWMEAEDPLFLLYTSGSTGNPKGVLHTTGGYMVMAGITTKYLFDLQPGDVYWCTADCGWITGHTYLTYGPLLNGATCVMYEGVPNYPTPARVWEIVEKYQVRVLYTAPTLVRALEAHDDRFVAEHDRSSLKLMGSVGEPINPRAWEWLYEVCGESRCPITDTYWQTETGAAMIAPFPGAWAQRPGSASLPFFGVAPVLLDDKGRELEGPAEGILAVKQAWPGMMRTLKGDHPRFEQTYFSTFKGYYMTGDGCRRDEQGYYTITGRVDDVINVSGHRVGTAEVEAALASHGACIEAAVVGVDHKIKGQGIYAFVTLHDGIDWGPAVKKELSESVRQLIGAFAAPDVLHFAPGLPKTRSGKIMRRVLRKIASKQEGEIGDVSTLADPSVVDQLLESRGK